LRLSRLRAAPAPSAPSPWRRHGPLLLLLAARLALGLAYSQIVPIWEADNEDSHFAYARYLATHHTLLLRPDDPEAAKIWESFQPPLYYDLIAPAIAGFNLGPTFNPPRTNPYIANGDAGFNYALHPVSPSPAEQSIEWAVRTARAVGVLISSLSLIPVYLSARRLWPKEKATAWVATTLYAFWPQFIFTSSMLTNDVLVSALAAVALWLAVDLALLGLRLRRAFALSAVVGAALLTKLNAVGLILLAAGALILSLRNRAQRRAQPLRPRIWVGAAGLALLVAAALWLLSSLQFITRQLFRLSVLRDLLASLGPNSNAAAGKLLLGALPYTFRTFLASYGWGNLETFSWLYWVWTVAALAALGGLVAAALRQAMTRLNGRWSQRGIPASHTGWVWVMLAAYVAMLSTLTLSLAIAQGTIYVVPGRYLLPTLPAILFLMVAGWRFWLRSPLIRGFAWKIASAGVVLVGLFSLVVVLARAYARPGPDTAAHISTPVGAFFGDSLELLGYDGDVRAVTGDAVQATLCWQAVAPVPRDYTLFLEVVGADGQGYGRLRTYPGHGNYPTSEWVLNTPFCERYSVQIGDDIPAPALAHLSVSFTAGTFGAPLPVRQSSGAASNDSAYLLEFKVAGQPGFVPPVAQATDYRLGRQIRLTGFEAVYKRDQVAVTLRWQALEDVTGNYVVFMHLRDTPDHAYAQGDSQPLHGAYPTRLWKKGEVILDTHSLKLPPGGTTPPLTLYVGMVDAATQVRLAVFDPSGRAVASDEIVLAQGLTFP
jgi:hypothetical protein